MKFWLSFGIILILLMSAINWLELDMGKSTSTSFYISSEDQGFTQYESTIIKIGVRDIPLHKQIMGMVRR